MTMPDSSSARNALFLLPGVVQRLVHPADIREIGGSIPPVRINMSRSIRRWIWSAKPYGADRHRHGTYPSLSITERTPGYEPGSVRSNRAGKIFQYRRMAKLASRPALNRKAAGSIPAAPAYGACRLTVKTPVCGTGDEGSTPSLYPVRF